MRMRAPFKTAVIATALTITATSASADSINPDDAAAVALMDQTEWTTVINENGIEGGNMAACILADVSQLDETFTKVIVGIPTQKVIDVGIFPTIEAVTPLPFKGADTQVRFRTAAAPTKENSGYISVRMDNSGDFIKLQDASIEEWQRMGFSRTLVDLSQIAEDCTGADHTGQSVFAGVEYANIRRGGGVNLLCVLDHSDASADNPVSVSQITVLANHYITTHDGTTYGDMQQVDAREVDACSPSRN